MDERLDVALRARQWQSERVTASAPPRSAIGAGVRDAGLLVLGYIPFALAAGAAMAQTHVSPVVSILSSPIIFAGASQLVAIQLLSSGAGIALVVFSVLVVNARHLLYSASLEPHWSHWSRGERMAGAFLLADPVYALAISRFERPGGPGSKSEQLGYYFAAGITCLIGWSGLVTVGVLLGGFIPTWIPLELAIPLTFLLLVLPLIKDRAGLVAATVGGFVALVAHPLPYGFGLMVGAAAGLVAGGIVLARTPDTGAHSAGSNQAEEAAAQAHGEDSSSV
jgi:predicted branched-subunit amino acid permease